MKSESLVMLIFAKNVALTNNISNVKKQQKNISLKGLLFASIKCFQMNSFIWI